MARPLFELFKYNYDLNWSRSSQIKAQKPTKSWLSLGGAMAQNSVFHDMLRAIAKVYEAEADPQGPHTAKTLLVTPSPVGFDPGVRGGRGISDQLISSGLLMMDRREDGTTEALYN